MPAALHQYSLRLPGCWPEIVHSGKTHWPARLPACAETARNLCHAESPGRTASAVARRMGPERRDSCSGGQRKGGEVPRLSGLLRAVLGSSRRQAANLGLTAAASVPWGTRPLALKESALSRGSVRPLSKCAHSGDLLPATGPSAEGPHEDLKISPARWGRAPLQCWRQALNQGPAPKAACSAGRRP